LFDRLDARAYNWGGDPYNTAHINAVKRRIYDFSFDYQNIALFQRCCRRSRIRSHRAVSINSLSIPTGATPPSLLDLFPGRQIQPYVAFYRNYGYGTGIGRFRPGRQQMLSPYRFRCTTPPTATGPASASKGISTTRPSK
jgi:hypothetical protein